MGESRSLTNLVVQAFVAGLLLVASSCSFEGAPGNRLTLDASPRLTDAATDASFDAAVSCSGYGNPFGSSIYFLAVGEFNHQDAANFCTNGGGSLAIIDDDAENQHLASILRDSNESFAPCAQPQPCAWIGLSQQQDGDEPDDGWSWLDGDDPFDEGALDRFAPGEPDDKNDSENNQENCAVLEAIPTDLNLNRWWDVACATRVAALCECPTPSSN